MTKGGFFPPSDMDPSEMARRLRDSLSPRDRAMHLLRHTLLDQQLDAIKAVMRNHEAEREGAGYQFEVLDTDPRGDGGLEALRDERFWQLTLRASAHSMAAVGMLAPFLESLFVAIFEGLKARVELPADHPRRRLPDQDVWNPQVYQGSKGARNDLLKGIAQLSEATSLARFLPPHAQMTLEALFRYRNNMFHNGFEWPERKIDSFAAEMSNWPDDWFERAERDSKSWLFYMSPRFCAHCVQMIDQVIDGVGRCLAQDKTGQI